MDFEGKLTPEKLKEIFAKIADEQLMGTLLVSDGESDKYIYFAKAGVRLLSSGARKNLRLGDLLLNQGKITEEQLKSILKRQKETGEMFGKILVEWGIVSDEEIDEAVKEALNIFKKINSGDKNTFKRTDNIKNCLYCDYKKLCNRDVEVNY